MFTIVISEKGGAERRETFDRGEISVGRVQGNDLMLPKGNVSKHHARLLLRDGRFIVTDLRSTNGTYVNGRKISQATIVREGDKIYIGDFVLRVEAGLGAAPSASVESPRELITGSAVATASVERSGVSVPAEAPSQPGLPQPPASVSTPAAPPQGPADIHNVSHFPLERDPDSESAPELRSAPQIPPLPGPPRMPQALDARPRAVSPPERDRPAPPVPPRANPAAVTIGGMPLARPPAPSALLREAPHQAARRLALIALVDRISDALDLGPLDRSAEVGDALLGEIDRVASEQAKAMRAEGEAPEGIDVDLLARDATRELAGLGPLGPLLDDDQTSEIHVARHDYVVATRNGQVALAEPGFSSQEALVRILGRLAHQAGEALGEDEAIVERRLGRGARLVAIGPPIGRVWSVTIRKARRAESTLEELVRASALSRAMATFLEACVVARANLLLVGADASTLIPVLTALLAATPAGERVVLVQDRVEITLTQPQVIPLALGGGVDGAQLLRAARRLVSERLALGSLNGGLAVPLLEAIAEGAGGVLAAMGAPSLRQGLARVVGQVALGRPGASIEAAREAVAESFDVAVEVGWGGAEGRPRIVRVAELVGVEAKGITTRDLFTSNTDPQGEPAFVVTGTTPRLAHEFAARGVRLDPNLFRRAK
jgi:pilus assembly protein CpaF